MSKGLGVLLLIAGTAVGCARYEPLPISSAGVDRALLLPPNATILERVSTLRNPLLQDHGFDLSDGMNSGEAAVLAVAMNPTLQADRDRMSSADAQLLQASVLPNPALSFSLDEPFGANASGQVSGYAVGLEWEFTSLISHGAKVQAARATRAQVRLDVIWKEWQIAEAAKEAFFKVVVLRQRAIELQQVSGQLQRIAGHFQIALKNGDATVTDTSAAVAASKEADAALESANRDVRDAELTLNQSLGLPPDTPIRLEAGAALPQNIPTAEASAYLKNLDNRRVDLVALRRGYDSQEATVRAAVLSQFPKISLGISQTRDYGDFLTLGPTATAELPIFDRNQGSIAIEKATRMQLYDEYIARVFEARSDIARAVMLIHSLHDSMKTQAEQIDELRSLVSSYEQAMQRGNLDISAYYAAAVNLSQKQSDLSKLKQDFIHVLISLELASGASLQSVASDNASATGTVR